MEMLGLILTLTLKNDLSKTKYPKFTEFYDTHSISRIYFFSCI